MTPIKAACGNCTRFHPGEGEHGLCSRPRFGFPRPIENHAAPRHHATDWCDRHELSDTYRKNVEGLAREAEKYGLIMFPRAEVVALYRKGGDLLAGEPTNEA